MDKINIREALTEKDIEKFWTGLHEYHARDIFPDPDDEDREYFLDDSQYRSQIDALHCREHDRSRYLFFERNGEGIGFALAVIYDSEDGKCFLMEFCVFPEYRGKGCGSACAEVFKAWAKENGGKYIELNCDTEQRQRFWSRRGFVPNGCDEWGVKLMLLPPDEDVPFTIAPASDGGDWQMHIFHRLAGTDQDQQFFGTGHSRIDQIALQHDKVLSQHRQDHHRKFTALGFVDRDRIGQ